MRVVIIGVAELVMYRLSVYMVAVITSVYWRGCNPSPPPPPYAPEEHYDVEPNFGYELALRTGNMYMLSFQIVYNLSIPNCL